ncbi:hypothetical protein SFC27_11180 [Bacillus licheniformis]|jgi:hypothetical protein|uniref:Phage related protein n=1 Tax=Bacillus licheniformis TaxID=1402 RepID=A0AB37GLR0_BACLI|nr:MULTISPECIES: hypothetical protein [Bacillus]ARC58683.1 hypothetical protein BaDB11_00013 [Bacillus licheniformis]AVI45308.1 hypothetical protein BL14DL4_00039 [Bacillus licheniformis]AVI49622.1 hypothetical protein BL14DL4_04487 [Bacillus licheniformis]AYC52064.1 hypothetical protein C7M53_12465 [Bacillus licheniformis]MBM6849507.1 hypothetical protein [Bacillus licheniformis]
MKTTVTYSPYPSNFSEVHINTGEEKSIKLSLVASPPDIPPQNDSEDTEENAVEISSAILADPSLRMEINDGISTEELMTLNKEDAKVLVQVLRDFLKQM